MISRKQPSSRGTKCPERYLSTRILIKQPVRTKVMDDEKGTRRRGTKFSEKMSVGKQHFSIEKEVLSFSSRVFDNTNAYRARPLLFLTQIPSIFLKPLNPFSPQHMFSNPPLSPSLPAINYQLSPDH